MKHLLFLITILLATSVVFGQEKSVRIGEIEFFGSAGINLRKVRAALPFHEGDEFRFEASDEIKNAARRSVRQVTNNAPTDVALVCCDDQGSVMIFVGLSGRNIRYNPTPKGHERLSPDAVNLYQQSMKALGEATRKGMVTEDRSEGYALSAYPPLRDAQLAMRAYALRHEPLLRRVLASSSDAGQRNVAAELLGYARRSGSQINALARASLDSDSGVRNNATRALVVLTWSDPKIANQIPAQNFIEMLLSGTWTDLNKASALISDLTNGRNPKLLARLRQPQVLERLIEIARWRTGHARPARVILGRMAGIEETRLQELVADGKVEAIIAALEDKR
ncbi:MAG TPA: hypothetical protein VGO91_19405 [Pyrinomonadaceae bacterium]|nr:hypothetical protein [Pyrinomonadaceae bacterium]